MLRKIIRCYKKHIFCCLCIIFFIKDRNERQSEREFEQSQYININLRDIVDQIRKTSKTSVQPLNNLTSSYRLLKIPLKKKCMSHICGSVDMIYLVKSSVLNFSKRIAIRETWGNNTRMRTLTIFIIGYSEPFQSSIDFESKKYDDILQFDMQDIYDNLVFKTVFSIAWLCDINIQAKFIHFVDDDRMINPQNLLDLAIKSIPLFAMKMIGFKVTSAKPYRRNSSKWYISVNEYEFDVWPPYLIGGTAVTNMLVIKTLREAIPYSKVIRIEDAYIGILANMLNINLEHNEGFLPVFVPGSKLIDKISSPDYKSYDIMSREWKVINSHFEYQ
ncbi:beta-1,3-galactosyltransferase brn-like [Mytilus edulis]|uniref:beta-1,3-galactosyltransferase brn-like n=1 Tax=Mytilus edulis TaxID=6550 RepID=UPI0039EFEA36